MYKRQEYEISSKTKGTVIDQSIEKGTKVDPTEKDRKIILTVSKGDYVVLGNYCLLYTSRCV